MVMTILEAHVQPANWTTLEQAYAAGIEHLPPKLLQTFLVHSAPDSTLWQIVGVWDSREALEEMRRSTETPAGVLMFRAAGTEPTLAVYDVAAHASGLAGESWQSPSDIISH